MSSIETRTSLRFHEGNALQTLANNYQTIKDILLEEIQNSLDAGATEINVTILPDKKYRNIIVTDNGEGVTPELMQKALSSVCQSIKTDEKMGRFGLGLISPIGKCQYFTFTSAHKTSGYNYHRWTFDCQTIVRSEQIGDIPYIKDKTLNFAKGSKGASGKKNVSWQTEVYIHQYTADRTLSQINIIELKAAILQRYREALKKNGAQIHLAIGTGKNRTTDTIKAEEFIGEPLKPVIYEDTDAGKTVFSLFVAPKQAGKRNGLVSIGIQNDIFRLDLKTFLKSNGVTEIVNKNDLLKISDTLCSGVFEGAITSEKCQLRPDRKGFAINDSLLMLIDHLIKWTEHHGMNTISNLQDIGKDEKYQNLGRQAMTNLENLILKNKDFIYLKEQIQRFNIGSIGSGHKDYADIINKNETEKITGFSSLKEKYGGKTKQNSAVTKTKQEHHGHMPLITLSKQGRRRALVKSHSLGLSFSHDEMPGEENLWRFDNQTGTIHFNIRHPLWEKAESSDRLLIFFQEFIALNILHTETLPSADKEIVNSTFTSSLPIQISLFQETITPKNKKKQLDIGRGV